MHEVWAVIGIVAALALGTISPGPSFVMVARTSMAASRRGGMAAALGMGIGGMVFATAALLGLNSVLTAVPALYVVLKIAGGLYLAYLGWRIFRGAAEPLVADAGMMPDRDSLKRTFLAGLATQVSNPKTAVVYASIFAAFMPASHSLLFSVAIVLSVFVIEAGWYSFVAVALSAGKLRALYAQFKRWIDRATGGVMVLLGLKLVLSAQRG